MKRPRKSSTLPVPIINNLRADLIQKKRSETKPLEGDAEDVIDEPAAEHQMPTDIENKVNSIMASEETITIIDKMTANHFGFETLHEFIKSEPTDELIKECADYFTQMTNMIKSQIEEAVSRASMVYKYDNAKTAEGTTENGSVYRYDNVKEAEEVTKRGREIIEAHTGIMKKVEEALNDTDQTSLYIPYELILYIFGENPEGIVYYDSSVESVVELINYINDPTNIEFLSNPDKTIQDKMDYMFGRDWKKPGTLLSTSLKNRTNFINALSDKERFKRLANLPLGATTVFDPNRVLGPNSQLTPECDIPPIVPNTEIKYEMVNHPSHYNTSSVETIEKMRRIWGNEATALWCEMTAFKYRERIGHKPDNSLEQEMGKIKWYEDKAKELRSK